MGRNWETSWNKELKTSLTILGNNILNQDMKEKRTQYIQQNNELMQEFLFAHSYTKSNINAIFKSLYWIGLLGFVWMGSRDDL